MAGIVSDASAIAAAGHAGTEAESQHVAGGLNGAAVEPQVQNYNGQPVDEAAQQLGGTVDDSQALREQRSNSQRAARSFARPRPSPSRAPRLARPRGAATPPPTPAQRPTILPPPTSLTA